MTRQKSFKNRVRARMDKTGESYVTARRQLLSTPEPASDGAAPAGVQPQQQSDASVRERTGRGWDEWFALLDAWDATKRTHTEIARWLVSEHEVDGWWAQNVTVTYEQARGMRAPGQRSDGTFAATGSKTIAAPVDRLFAAFDDPALRERWLPEARLTVRKTTPPKSFRADWSESGRIAVGFVAKGPDKAQIALMHEKLPDAETAAEMKAYWAVRLSALKSLLENE